jgi:nucleotide-binding universal stress UspA family protein
MYKHILIPTDGSELANKAVEHGIALAKAIGARITVVTVTVPFHIFTLDPQVVEETSDQYKQRIQRQATAAYDGVAWKARRFRNDPWQRNGQSAHALEDPRSCSSVISR